MSNASLASIQNTARQMLSALTANAEAVSARGGGEILSKVASPSLNWCKRSIVSRKR